MSANKDNILQNRASGDSFFLMFVRIVTIIFGLLVTRVLSGHFSLYEYGTYSQIILLTTTITSMTTLGMMDGLNYFFCKEKNREKRDAYVSTIFFLHYFIGAVVSIVVLSCSVPIARYFGNEGLKSIIIFAAIMPVLNNSIYLLQIMFVAIGSAKTIGVRNLIVSILKFVAVVFACYLFDNIVVVLIFQVVTDTLQVLYFFITLGKRNYKINIFRFDKSLIKEIFAYCIPMAMFAVIKSLNRDADKFVISFFTNTETLAVYTNASKLLPFDIVVTSFCTVLLPYITRFISNKEYNKTSKLYKSFLELSYISTSILAVGAICVAPELMRFLYTERYVTQSFSVIVFIIYTLVEIISVFNITIILSASGKTKTILYASLATFVLNIVLNVVFFLLIGECGPAIATFVVTLMQGMVFLSISAKTIQTRIFKLFNIKYLLVFALEIIVFVSLSYGLRKLLVNCDIHYFLVLFIVYGFFFAGMLLLNLKKLIKNIKLINESKMEVGVTETTKD